MSSIKLDTKTERVSFLPRILIFGVGGGGGNAVNNMIKSNLEGVEFIVANTDAQSLQYSLATTKIQLGSQITKGLGAGAVPDVGKKATEEVIPEIESLLKDANMIFITAGMGGGTGTGSAPVIAKLAKERDILTIAVVTKPFHFEGINRMKAAEAGIKELQKYVDTLIVIPNQNLFRIANEKTTFSDAFQTADNVLYAGVKGITDLITMPGLINLDFADIRTIMRQMGKAMMGTGEASGADRAIKAAEFAITNPLLDNVSMKGARGVLINITGGSDMTLFEVEDAVNRIRKEIEDNANIIFGSIFNPDIDGFIRVSVVATGIDTEEFGANAPSVKDNIQKLGNRIDLRHLNVANEQSLKVRHQLEEYQLESHQDTDNRKVTEHNDAIAESRSARDDDEAMYVLNPQIDTNKYLQTEVNDNEEEEFDIEKIDIPFFISPKPHTLSRQAELKKYYKEFDQEYDISTANKNENDSDNRGKKKQNSLGLFDKVTSVFKIGSKLDSVKEVANSNYHATSEDNDITVEERELLQNSNFSIDKSLYHTPAYKRAVGGSF